MSSVSPRSVAVFLPRLAHDLILSLPFVARLCQQLPGARVEVFGNDFALEVYALAMERGLAAHASVIKSLIKPVIKLSSLSQKPCSHDLAFLLDRSWRAGFAVWKAGVAERVGFASGAPSFFYTMSVATSWNERHSEINRHLDLLRAFFGGAVEAWPPDALSMMANREAAKLQDPVVLLTLSSEPGARSWAPEPTAQLCEQLAAQGVEIWLEGNLGASPLAEQIQILAPSLLVKNICADRSLRERLDLLQQAHCVVSADLPTVQWCSDLATPVVALWGDRLPELGYAPWRRRASAIGISERHCLACEREGLKHRVHGRHICLDGMGAPRVYREVRRWVDVLA